TQVSYGAGITAVGQYEGESAEAGDIASSVQALGNSQGFSVSAAVSGVRATQNNSADISADGGGVVGYVDNTASFSAAASANNITSAAGYGSSERMIADQNSEGGLVQAAQFTAFGNVYVAHTSATASGNNISAGNEGALLDMSALQQNQAYVRAQAESSGYPFGSGTATAYGIGNSLLAGQLGEEVILDVEQLNIAGGVEAIAAFTGHDGYDASASAMAMGNASTGYVCSECDGRMSVNNRQTNDADVAATGTVTVTGSARSAVGAANAVGNTASYYASRPQE
ncbi:holdfast anchor protein HfaD, partial [Phenylobacterium sp.]|uniref:holdfast anchor protein HfaD n=1 Tax=Phenylobacterium sp. TaxID=1871053 RepID=UPI002E37665F